MAEVRRRLSDDHHAVSEVLKELLTALNNKDVETSYSKLDLLWARLAVHIRAEHLHLFPAIASKLAEAQPVIDRLRADHDFFMRELARAMGILRELPRDEVELAAVGDTIREIEKRLATHNKIEEDQIYRWSSTVLTESEQFELLARINAELKNRPPRFSQQAWANCL
ncbi:MAG TPA: hemerythrin domain-containing protein [Pyrinomonadaceae bacterium]